MPSQSWGRHKAGLAQPVLIANTEYNPMSRWLKLRHYMLEECVSIININISNLCLIQSTPRLEVNDLAGVFSHHKIAKLGTLPYSSSSWVWREGELCTVLLPALRMWPFIELATLMSQQVLWSCLLAETFLTSLTWVIIKYHFLFQNAVGEH